jgi:hypothetical protein
MPGDSVDGSSYNRGRPADSRHIPVAVSSVYKEVLMRASRFALGAILVVALLFGLTSSASAATGQKQRPTRTTSQHPVSFTIDPASCSAISSLVTGTGTWSEVILSSPTWRGFTKVDYHASASGTAVDATGATYTFTYHNTRRYSVPDDGSPFQELMIDDFHLVRPDGSLAIDVGFSALITFASPDGNPISFDHFFRQRGYRGPGFPPCDPI